MGARDLKNIETLVDLLERRADVSGDDVAFTFLPDRADTPLQLTYRQLESRVRRLAGELQRRGAAGERAIVIGHSNLEFVVAFFASVLAGAVAVPVAPPRPQRSLESFAAVVAAAAAKFVLAPASYIAEAAAWHDGAPALRGLQWVATDALGTAAAAPWQRPAPSAQEIAYLQFTSGSTRAPRGVMISHQNIVANMRMIDRAFRHVDGAPAVGWLPLYHDMGLISVVLEPVFVGVQSVFMSPFSFLQRPMRWLQAISDYRASSSGGPNFAYDLAARKVRDEQLAALDLSAWSLAFCGAEPVRADTMAAFARAFAPAGFRYDAFYPCYGLAEATLFVTGGDQRRGPRLARFDGSYLAHDVATPAVASDGDDCVLVDCGYPWDGLAVEIVDPDSGERLPEGLVGEVWVAGPSVAKGYWNQPEETAATFGARLAGDGERTFLRTGDLGFRVGNGLFLTCRLKDLIVVDGRNHHPQDIERTVELAHPAVRSAGVAAFAIERGGRERLAIVAEADLRAAMRPGGAVRGDRSAAEPADEVIRAIRRRVADTHDQSPFAVALIGAGKLPKTTSGKVRRQACRELLESDALPVRKLWRLDAAGDDGRRPRPAGAPALVAEARS